MEGAGCAGEGDIRQDRRLLAGRLRMHMFGSGLHSFDPRASHRLTALDEPLQAVGGACDDPGRNDPSDAPRRRLRGSDRGLHRAHVAAEFHGRHAVALGEFVAHQRDIG
ncbi:hypothetical protein RSWS8N_20629 (plasmid) [Cereibacter sphaeroides WS8N]|nr:hypothetical protein RSWS8N_20629 [Cereibacter sphaeroides WS8N]